MNEGFSEHDFLAWIRSRGVSRHDDLIVGLGDDAAAWHPEDGGTILIANDAVLEGTHVEYGPKAPARLARKVLRSNLSDLAAMGGRGELFFLTMKMPRGVDASAAREVIEILEEDVLRYGVTLAGGDTVIGDGGWLLSGTIVGRSHGRPVRRCDTQVGDLVVVTGSFGGSIRGKHWNFEPRLEEARLLCALGPPTAMADVSDGLARDLGNIAEASGVTLHLDADAIPISDAARDLSKTSGRSSLDHALNDGEDFELIFTVSEKKWSRIERGWKSEVPLSVIGRAAEAGTGSMLTIEEKGKRRSLEPGGYDHGH